jgi:hypothetical protein
MQCPKCKYARSANDTELNSECPKCGIIYDKYDPFAAQREASLREKLANRIPKQQPIISPVVLTPVISAEENVVNIPPSQSDPKVTACPACSGLVAYGAKACPHCGKDNPAPGLKPSPKPVGKIWVLIGCFFVIFWIFNISQNSTSNSSTSNSKPEVDPAFRREAQAAIQLAGYKCDSISFIGRLITKTGFRVTCNDDRYAYAITDEGGRIIVRLD